MFDAIKSDNARYAAFAASMIAGLAAEVSDIAKRDAAFASRQIAASNVDNAAATIAPAKRAA